MIKQYGYNVIRKKTKNRNLHSPNKQPWDDAVTLALTYAEVDYETLWDTEVHLGNLMIMIGFICITKISLGNMESFIGAIETQSGIKSKKTIPRHRK